MIAQGQPRDDLPAFMTKEQYAQLPDRVTKLYTERPTYILWIVSSWTICFLNLVFVVLTIRDMWTNGYTAGTHGLSIAIITCTIFGLMLIHEKIIRK